MSIQPLGLKTSNAAPLSAVEQKLRAARTRIRALLFLRYGSYALLGGSLIGLCVLGLSKFNLFEEPSPLLTGGIIAASLVGAGIATLLRKLTLLDAARLTDRRADLKDRLTSAVQFQNMGIDPNAPFYGEQFADAAIYAQQVDLKTAFPLRIPRLFWVGVLATLTLFAMHFMPSLPAFWSKEKKDEVAEVKHHGIAIVKLAEEAKKFSDTEKLVETKKAAEDAKKLGEAMKKSEKTKKQSFVEMQKLNKQMEEQQKKLAEEQARRDANTKKAGEEFKKSLEQMQKDIAQKREEKDLAAGAKPSGLKPNQNSTNKLPDGLQKQKGMEESPKADDSFKSMMQFANAMQKMDQMSMKDALDKLAEMMEKGDINKEQLKDIANALKELEKSMKKNGMDKESEEIRKLLDEIQKALDNLDKEKLKRLAEMMKHLSKDLNKQQMQGKLDAEALKQMLAALKQGRVNLGNCSGGT